MSEIQITPQIDPETGVRFLNTSVQGAADIGTQALDELANAAACHAEVRWLRAMVAAIETPGISDTQRNEFLELTGMVPSKTAEAYPDGGMHVDEITLISRTFDLLARGADLKRSATRNTSNLSVNGLVIS